MPSLSGTRDRPLRLYGEIGIASEPQVRDEQPLGSFGYRPDYGSGPYLLLMTAAIRLARLDLSDPIYSAGARRFLESDLVAIFAECIGYEGGFE